MELLEVHSYMKILLIIEPSGGVKNLCDQTQHTHKNNYFFLK